MRSKGLEQYLTAHPVLEHDAQTLEDCAFALELLAPFHDELKPLLPALNPLWTHNDLHASNLFWSDRGQHAHATSVIDFGLADRTNAIYDLAQAIERNIVEWLVLTQDPSRGDDVPVHLDHLWAMLDGYEQVRPLSRSEAVALAPMLALAHAEFALTEADYFLRRLAIAGKSPRRYPRLPCWSRAMVSRPRQVEDHRAFTPMGRNTPDQGGARMIASAVAHYLVANWVELARLFDHGSRNLAHH